MKSLLQKTIQASCLFIVFIATLNYSLPALAADQGTYDANAFKAQSGLDISANVSGYDTSPSAATVDSVIGTVILTFLSLVGIIFMGLVIYGGITWMTAQGNEEKVKKANGIVMSALFGLIVTLSAYIISYLLINYLWK